MFFASNSKIKFGCLDNEIYGKIHTAHVVTAVSAILDVRVKRLGTSHANYSDKFFTLLYLYLLSLFTLPITATIA